MTATRACPWCSWSASAVTPEAARAELDSHQAARHSLRTVLALGGALQPDSAGVVTLPAQWQFDKRLH